MRLALQVILAAVLLSTAFASDIVTRDGKKYQDARVTGVESDGLRITHSGGVTKVYFDNLPDELQKEYNYAPEEAKAAESARATTAHREAQESARRRDEEHVRQVQREAADERRHEIREVGRAVLRIGAICIGVLLYFVPTAVGRHKVNVRAIFVLNLFLGWTCVGWVLALVWACTKDIGIETHAQVVDLKRPEV